MSSGEKITISIEEYEKLTRDAMFLEALKACGVDNWQAYDDALEMLAEWDAEPEE